MALGITEISAIVAAVGVLVGVVYYILTIRHQVRTRDTDLVIRLSPWFNMNGREMQEAVTQVCSIKYKDYEDYLERYSERPENVTLKILGNYFEGIGILVHRKLVKAEVVYDFWGGVIQSSWERIQPIVADMRKETGDSNMFQFWEYLYNEMKKKEQAGVKNG